MIPTDILNLHIVDLNKGSGDKLCLMKNVYFTNKSKYDQIENLLKQCFKYIHQSEV